MKTLEISLKCKIRRVSPCISRYEHYSRGEKFPYVFRTHIFEYTKYLQKTAKIYFLLPLSFLLSFSSYSSYSQGIMEIYHTDALFQSIPDYDYHFLRSDALYVGRYLPNCKDP